jgi:hypothetical protein
MSMPLLPSSSRISCIHQSSQFFIRKTGIFNTPPCLIALFIAASAGWTWTLILCSDIYKNYHLLAISQKMAKVFDQSHPDTVHSSVYRLELTFRLFWDFGSIQLTGLCFELLHKKFMNNGRLHFNSSKDKKVMRTKDKQAML